MAALKRPHIREVEDRSPAKKARITTENAERVPVLTCRALREFDRHNARQRPVHTPPQRMKVEAADLRRFARLGGPDLSSLRGCPFPNPGYQQMAASGLSRTPRKSDKTSTYATKRPSAADTIFERILVRNNILSDEACYSQDLPIVQCNNLDKIQHELSASRASLSPSRRGPSEHENFKRANAAVSEAKVLSDVIPFLCGTGTTVGATIANEQNLLFNNLASLTSGATVDPKPDFFDGARSRQVHDQVQSDLDAYIVPTMHLHAPIAPNYFLEAKTRLGSFEEARRQIIHDVAAGSRAMNALQNYREATTAPYDGNAYTLGATYHGAGLVKIYAGHMQPGSTGPQTYVNEVTSFIMTRDIDSYYEGVRAFRNARDLAYKWRNDLIKSANAKVQPAQHQLEHGDQLADDSGEGEALTGTDPTGLPPTNMASSHAGDLISSTTPTSPSIRYRTRSKRQRSPSSSHDHRATTSRARKRQ